MFRRRAAGLVFAYLVDPVHLRHWLPQLRREATDLPAAGLDAARAAGTVRWSFESAGKWRVRGAKGVTTLTLRPRRHTAPAVAPTVPGTPEDATRFGAAAALQSLNSHLEGAGGGPDLRTADAPSRAFGRGAP